MVWLGAVWGCLVLGGPAARADEASLAALVGKLTSADESVRLQAIDQLGAGGAKSAPAVAPLMERLKDDSAQVRAHAVRALGEIGAPAKPAVADLIELAKDPDETVRRQVVKAVIKIRPGPQVTVPLCVKLLEDADPGVRMRILQAVADAGPKAVPGLIVALKHEKAAYWACLVLREIGPPAKDAMPALIDELKNPRPEIRREAILALAAMGDEATAAVEPIAATLGDEYARAAATYALGRIGRIPADAETAIRANGKSDDKMLSTTSLWALARVHPEDTSLRREATEQLLERLKDRDPLVRLAAARALAALPPAPEITAPLWEKALQGADEKTVLHALDALAALGPPAVPRLVDALQHEKLRGQVVYVLGKMGPAAAPATPALAKLIADKDDHVAQEAILALANIGPGAKEAVPALAAALEQGEKPNAHAVAYALGRIGPAAAEALPALFALLDNSDRQLALVSAWALVRISPASAEVAEKTLPVLIAGLKGRAPLARRGAAEALGGLGPAAKEAVPALRSAASDKDPSVRAAVARALALIHSDQGQ
jgi:HEAT repeat protein